MASQRDDERDEQPAASQSDDKPEWRSARVTGEGGNNDCRGCALLLLAPCASRQVGGEECRRLGEEQQCGLSCG